MVDEIHRLMQRLGADNVTEEETPAINRDLQEEVIKVIAHRITKSGEFEFKLLFKSRSSHWVLDSNCDCEWLISDYLFIKRVKTAFVVCRVSTKDQAASTNLSLDGQETSIRYVIPTGVYERIKVVRIAQSAYKSIPHKLQAIGEAARAGDAIFVYRVDRLSRNIEKFIYWLKDLDERDVSVLAVLDQAAMVDGEDESSLTLDYRSKRLTFIQAVLDAEKEASILSNKMKVSMKRRRDRGDEAIGGLPYGKKFQRSNDGSNRLLVVIDPEVGYVCDIISRGIKNYSKKLRESMKSICQRVAVDLNSRDLRKRGRVWTCKMVSDMVQRYDLN